MYRETQRKTDRYGSVAVALHWLIAVAIIANVVIGWYFPTEPPNPAHLAPGAVAAVAPRFTPKPLLPLHVSLGLSVLVLSVARLAWRLTHRPPPFPATMPRWEKALAHAGHVAFYLLIIAMPFTGWAILSAHKVHKQGLTIFGIVPWPHLPGFTALPVATVDRLHDQLVTLHGLLTLWLLPALLLVHVGAVAKHHLFDADPVLRRMMPRWGRGARGAAVTPTR